MTHLRDVIDHPNLALLDQWNAGLIDFGEQFAAAFFLDNPPITTADLIASGYLEKKISSHVEQALADEPFPPDRLHMKGAVVEAMASIVTEAFLHRLNALYANGHAEGRA